MSTTHKPGMRIRRGDVLLVSFGDRPSVFKVLKADYKKRSLRVKVIVDHYVGAERTYATGEVVDIGHSIYEGFWFFKRCRNDIEIIYPLLSGNSGLKVNEYA